MGIVLASNFDMNAALPLDSRLIKADVAARNAIVAGSRYIGLTVYCVAEDKLFRLVGGILDANWVDVTSGKGVVANQETDATTTGANQTATLGALVHIFTNASLTSLAGLIAPTTTTLAILVNRRGGDITVVNNATATAANRIITGTGGDLTWKDGSALWVVYDTVAARWQVVGGSGSGSGGGFSNIVTKTSSGTILSTEDCILVNAASGNVLLTLPPLSIGEIHRFKRIDSVETNTVTIQRAGSDTLDGQTSVTIPYQYGAITAVGIATNLWGLF